MEIITTGEFRSKLASYLKKVDEGKEILVQRGKNKSYRIVPIKDDDYIISKEQLDEIVEQGMQEAMEGKGLRLDTIEDFKKHFKR
ncbi:MAG: type II toxin-antitoxin system Phd/YefM family antitoxin [Bacteroidales bacterium]